MSILALQSVFPFLIVPIRACSWDDNRLRSYLESKNVIKTKQQATRDELLGKMKDVYGKTVNPVWQAWSDSYIVSHIASIISIVSGLLSYL